MIVNIMITMTMTTTIMMMMTLIEQVWSILIQCLCQSPSSSSVQLDSKCNQACNCSGVRFDPVCGGSLTYFSPCHAGCGQVENYNEVRSPKCVRFFPASVHHINRQWRSPSLSDFHFYVLQKLCMRRSQI